MAATPEENIDDTPVSEELETSFLAYAMSVIVARALPDVRDGLKPVHRRILHSMQDLNLTSSSSYVKSARVVGDCFVAGTLVATPDGLQPIEELEVGDQVLDPRGKAIFVVRTFANPPLPVVDVDFNDGRTLRVTPGQLFKTLKNDLSTEWTAAKDLAGKTVLATGASFDVDKNAAPDSDATAAAYALGLMTAEGWRVRGSKPTDSTPVLATTDSEAASFVTQWAARCGVLSEANTLSPEHKTHRLPYVVKFKQPGGALEKAMKSLHCKKVPAAVLRQKDLFLPYLAGFLDGQSQQRRHELVFSDTNDALLRDLASMLAAFGVVSRLSRSGQYKKAWTLEVSGKQATALAKKLVRFSHVAATKSLLGSLANETKAVGIQANLNSATQDKMADLEQNFTQRQVIAVREVTEPEVTYDIEVGSKEHAFIAEGIYVHNCIGRFHPHGDSAVYDSLVRMAQSFSMSVPLVDGHGNFGTHDDPAAAMRYTECRMSHAAMAMTDEIDEDTVDMKGNYDGKVQEPTVLPAAFPNLLVNGSEGIAVGMTTKIPPHNLAETVQACQHLLANPDAKVEDLIKIVPAPDMPTGGLLLQVGGAQDAYRTGKGTFKIRARTEIVGRDIVVSELPYQVGIEKVTARIKAMRDAGKLDEVSSAVDLSDRRSGMRLVITVKRTNAGVPVNPEAVLRKLFKYTPLEESFTIHFLALVDGSPKTLTLLDMVKHYVNHRIDVTRRRCEHRKRKAEARIHLLEGYLIALENIDDVVAVIRSSRDTESARNKLMKQFKLTEIQASNILEMPLRRLTSLEVRKIKDDLAELRKKVAELTKYLTDDKAMRQLVSDELGETSAKFAGPRRSTIASLEASKDEENEPSLEVPDVPCRIQLSTTGKLGRFSTDGHKGARTKDDAVAAHIETSVRNTVGVITNTGRLLHLHPMDIPVCEGRNRGVNLTEFVPDIAKGEQVVAFVDTTSQSPVVVLFTAQGFVKKIAPKDFHKTSGQAIIGFKSDEDYVVSAFMLPANDDENSDFVAVTKNAQLLRFATSSVRAQGRSGSGVAAIKLGDGDVILTASVIAKTAGEDSKEMVVATLSDGGGIKWTPAGAYPSKGRGTGGVRCQRMGRGETELVSAQIGPWDEVMSVAKTGALNKLPSSAAKRDAMGEKAEASALVLRRP